jgi:TonB family protein
MPAAALAAAVLLSASASAAVPRDASPQPSVGRVVVECLVAPQGALTDCLVVEETPAGRGLGQRALEEAAKLTMDAPVAGARVRVPFSYRL